MRAAIYVRVSTDHAEQKLSPENQIATCQEYAADLGLEVIDPTLIYNDAGISGTEMLNRPEVQRLVADARLGRFDAVLFTAISRFARDLSDALALKKRLETVYGIRIISVEEGYDTAIEGRNSEMVFTVHAMLAAHKSEEMSKAIRRGLRQSAKKGRHIGNVTPYGYLKGPDKHLIPNPETQGIVSDIYDMYLSGLGSRSIATKLNQRGIPAARGGTWQNSTINAILRNPVYKGSIVASKWRNDVDITLSRIMDRKIKRWQTRDEDDWVMVDDAHPPIIDKERWEAVQAMLSTKERHKAMKRTTGNMLAGLMRCAECGGAMCVRSGKANRNGQPYKYVACLAVGRVSKDACCNHRKHKYYEILQAVIDPLRRMAMSPELQAEMAERFVGRVEGADWDSREQEVSKALEKNKKRQLKLVQMMTDDDDSLDSEVLAQHYADLRAEQERLTMQLSEVAAAREQQAELVNRTKEIAEIVSIFDHLDEYEPIMVRTALSTLIGGIKFYADGRVQVEYTWNPDSYTPVSDYLT
ncbi:recombinase family protein [Alicyclobacillus fodiniaquatilis]|uniref:Recombinase family protein n=1 Tax=Alicyclobacillus fodiniaquatilis TaxID=1661150 RepID=A0ABW4JEX7_9BACL